MSHRIRALVALVLVSFALSTAACASATGPQPAQKPCDTSGSNICR